MNHFITISLISFSVSCGASATAPSKTAADAQFGVPAATPSALHLLPSTGAPDVPVFSDKNARGAISSQQRADCNEQCHAELTEEECQMWRDGLTPRKCAWRVPMIGEDD